MYVHRVEFGFVTPEPPEQLADLAMAYLGAARMNGQVCGREWPLFREDGCVVAVVMAPEAQSLEVRYDGQYVAKAVTEASAAGVLIRSQCLSRDAFGADSCACHDPAGYVLYTHFISLEPCVRCLDCFAPIPLYRLPVLSSGEYYELIGWQSDYQNCDSLQMNCRVLERAATGQLSSLDSALSNQGREICAALAERTGKPFYYYLYRGNGRSVAQERRRCCPSCGKPWRIESPLHDLFDCRCDDCRLLSNFAWNLRDGMSLLSPYVEPAACGSKPT